MWTHNSAGIPGGPIALFISGYFFPWWQNGILRVEDWSFLWPVTTIASLVLAIKTKISDIKFFFFLLPILYILLISTQVPFARYFLIVLPYAYLNFSYLLYFLLNKTQFEQKRKWTQNFRDQLLVSVLIKGFFKVKIRSSNNEIVEIVTPAL